MAVRPTPLPYLLLLAVLTLLSARDTHAQTPPPLKRTFEQCDTATPCGEPLGCVLVFDIPFRPCPPGNKKGCRCMPPDPPGFRSCSRSENCPDGEDCAISKSSGTAFCQGCEFLRQSDNIETIKEKSSKRCAPTPPPKTPPIAPGLAADFCSPTSPCAPSYACLAQPGRFCEPADVLCQCEPSDGGLLTCTSPEDCPDAETCSQDVMNNKRQCVSCLYSGQDIGLRTEPSDKCDNFEKKPLPQYPGSPNGLSFDPCVQNITCVHPRTCRADAPGLPACNPAEGEDGNCFCFASRYNPGENECTASDHCPVGELCTQFTNRVEWICVSQRLVKETPLEGRRVRGNKALPNPKENGGLSGDSCAFDWDCFAPRRCTHILERFGGCAGRRGCYCSPLVRDPCEDDAQCPGNEVCVNYRGALTQAFCRSKRLAASDVDLVPVANLEEVPAPTLEEVPTPTPFDTEGLTGDRCLSDSDCAPKTFGERICRHVTESVQACDGRPSCFCEVKKERDNSCITSADCTPGEICVEILDALSMTRFCRSAAAVEREPRKVYSELPAPRPSPSVSVEVVEETLPSEEPIVLEIMGPTVEVAAEPEAELTAEATVEDEVCVDARALAHLGEGELVYRTARRARVLCDLSGSCATAGHIIVWRGVAMRMQTYCDVHAECGRRSMLVNSPRLRHGLRVASRTEGFEFTAFAARFNSRLEEHVLTRLVHIGL